LVATFNGVYWRTLTFNSLFTHDVVFPGV
jgi:hypothetical protein